MADPVAELARQAERLQEEIRRAERASAIDMLQTAQRFSSGPFSTQALGELDHPFARRHGSPLLDASRVNRQSGEFLRGWELRPDGSGGFTLVNSDPKAALVVGGSKFAFARPIVEAVVAEVTPRRNRRLRQAMERAVEE